MIRETPRLLLRILISYLLLIGLLWMAAEVAKGTEPRIREGGTAVLSYYRGSQGACGHALHGNYAAHKTLACGTRVKLRKGGKTVTVTIEDRCPTCGKRGLDLSKHAFSQLAPTSAGVVNARVVRITR